MSALCEAHVGEGRATSDLSDAARAATYGAIDVLLVDIDVVVPGTMDEVSGAVSFADISDATSYGIVDEVAGRALASGAKVLGVRKADLLGQGELAPISSLRGVARERDLACWNAKRDSQFMELAVAALLFWGTLAALGWIIALRL